MTTKSITLVSVQLLCIMVLVITGPVVPRTVGPLALVVGGVAIIVWAMFSIGLRRLTVGPEPRRDARLVTRGPYRMIRHPMYTGGSLITAGWLWGDFTVLRLVVGIVLIGDFLLKLRYEESLLAARFENYRDYMQTTRRLIPFIY